MAVESLLYRPLALLPVHARALFERARVNDVTSRPSALMQAVDQGWRPYDVVSGVAVVPVCGVLVHGDGWWGETGYTALRAALEQAVADADVKAIALHVDSPGGDVAGCFDLADRILALRAVKPIVALVDELACSAAYALACSAERIVAPRTAVIGSIGIVTSHVDMTGALDQAGIRITTIQYGDRKTDSYPTTPLSDAARDRMQADVDHLGEMFVALVARNRGLDPEKVRATEAGCFLGEAALGLGLVDAVMPVDAAFSAILKSLSE